MSRILTDTENYLLGEIAHTTRATSVRGKLKALGRSEYSDMIKLPLNDVVERIGAIKREKAEAREIRNRVSFESLVSSNAKTPRWVLASQVRQGYLPEGEETGIMVTNTTIRDDAYDATRKVIGNRLKLDFGVSSKVGELRETDNGKFGWNRVVWRYADYMCLVRRDLKEVAIKLPYGSVKVKKMICNRIMWGGKALFIDLPQKSIESRMKPRHAIKLLNIHSKGLKWMWDREVGKLVLNVGGESYHLDITEVSMGNARFKVRQAVAALRKRKKERINIAGVRVNSSMVYVSLEDSVSAGNCTSMSKEFAKKMWNYIGAVGPCAVLGSIILAVRDDHFTRRAVNGAIQHHGFAIE